VTITQAVIKRARQRGVTVHDRRAWGSRLPHVYAWRRLFRKVAPGPADTLVQHITVTRRAGIKADARTVESIGQARFGSGVSYNWLVDMVTGEVAVGQPLDAKGTHTVNDKRVAGYSHDQNLVARAIAVVGMPGDQLSPAAREAIAQLIAAMIEQGALTRGFDYCPHSLFAAKDCPCGPTRDAMPAIRARVVELLPERRRRA
jgi:hypothetical protein